MPTYKNKTDQELVIPNVGVVEAHGTITSEEKLENSYLEEVASTTPAPQPEETKKEDAEVKE